MCENSARKSLSEFADLLKLRSLASSTQEEYQRHLHRLTIYTDRDPATLSKVDVRAYIVNIKDNAGFSASTQRTLVAALHTFYNRMLGYDWRLFSLIRTPSRKTVPKILTRQQVAALFSAIKENRYYVLFRLIYACGLRVSEATNLTVADVEAEGTRLRIRAAKNNKDRLVPLPAWILAELRQFWKTHRNPLWLFPRYRRNWRKKSVVAVPVALANKPLSVTASQHYFRKARRAAHLPATTCLHTLRHSYATDLLEGNRPVAVPGAVIA
jgi:integrase/recombinase XerD